MCTRVAALLLAHEPVIVAPAARVGELCAGPGLLVVSPARVIAQTGALGQGLAAHRDLGLGPAQRLALTTCQESISVSETASVMEFSAELSSVSPLFALSFTCRAGWRRHNTTPCNLPDKAPSLEAGSRQLSPGD